MHGICVHLLIKIVETELQCMEFVCICWLKLCKLNYNERNEQEPKKDL